jgi:hypothetical protein
MGCEESVKVLLENGAAEDKFSLQEALRSAYVDNGIGTAPLLLAAGAEVGLFEAVFMDDPVTVKALIAKGADVNQRDYHGRTPLIVACTECSPSTPSVASLLLKGGADPNARADNGDTPISCSEHMPDSELTRLLRLHGAQ